jgi:predicted  nucleic acid-binding Zn-ribbon protein
MADEGKVDIRKVIDEGAKRATLSDLAQRGITNVKVLDEQAVEDLIRKAVDKVVSTQTADERARIVANSRKELDRLMKERNEFLSRAGLLEAGKNDLVKQVEKLQNELQLRRQIEEQGEAGFMVQLKEMVERQKVGQEQVQALQEENAALRSQLAQAQAEVRRLSEEIESLRATADAEQARLDDEARSAQRERDEARESLEAEKAGRAKAEQDLQDALRETGELRGREEGLKDEARRAGEAAKEARGEAAVLKDRLQQEQEKAKKRDAEVERQVQQAKAEAAAPPAPKAKAPRKEKAPAATPLIVLPPTPEAPEPPPPPPEPAPARPAARAPAGKIRFKEGKGLDVGTVNLVAAEQDEKGDVELRLIRNAFVDVPIDTYTKSIMTRLKVPYVVQDKKMYVLGEDAFELANVLNRNTRRPMKDGLISPQETNALPVMKLLIGAILGEPRVADEACYYSIPGDPIDSDLSVLYHRDLFDAVLKSLGYRPRPINEGHAVTFAELGAEDFTGIGISCGGGMFNICVAYKSMPALHFSTARAGDWIDQNAGQALGIKPSRITMIKEKGVDLVKPKTREEDAISIYYRDLIQYTLTNIKERFLSSENMPTFSEAIPIVFSGGTSMANGFIDLARAVFRDLEFPIPVKELRMASDPLHATAKGCLTAALLEMAQKGA